MIQVPMHRVSWWGKSSYTAVDVIIGEKTALAAIQGITILPDNQDCEIAIIHSGLRVDKDTLSDFPSVKWIITTTSGYDHIDIESIRARRVHLIRMPLLRRDAVVESTLMNILYSTRQQPVFTQSARTGQWVRSSLNTIGPKRVQDCTIGVVGCGVIGERVIEKLVNLEAKVVAFDPRGIPNTVPSLSFEEMASACDVITFHCSLSTTSRNMVNKHWLLHVPNSVALVNTARGSILDHSAVKDGLNTGKISFLAIDVFPQEPPSDIEWWGRHPNVLCTPHAAGYHPKLAEMRKAKLIELAINIVGQKSIQYVVTDQL